MTYERFTVAKSKSYYSISIMACFSPIYYLVIFAIFTISSNCQAQSCINNLIQNPSFEDVATGSNCDIQNNCIFQAFNYECPDNWVAARNTPDLCDLNNGVTAFDGQYFSNQWFTASPSCRAEVIMQDDINLFLNQEYQLSLAATSSLTILDVEVWLTSGMTTNTAGPPFISTQPCPSFGASSQLIGEFTAGINGNWQQLNLPPFQIVDPNNTQLVILPVDFSGVNNGGVLNVDDLCLSCVSQLTPSFTYSQDGPTSVDFMDTTMPDGNITPSSWLWTFPNGDTLK